MHQLSVQVYRAAEIADACERNAAEHARVLELHGLSAITSARPGWWHDEQTHVLLLQEATPGEPLGAVRLQRWNGRHPLPIEAALAGVDRRVGEWIAGFAGEGVAELCGLWCAPQLKGFGLGSALIRMGLSLATPLGVRTVLGLCDTRHLSWNLGFGFARDLALAKDGRFEYPRPGLFAHVLRIADAQRLDAAADGERRAIVAYRGAPLGNERVESHRGRLELARDLRVDNPPRAVVAASAQGRVVQRSAPC
jgi:hypothetical protein